MTFFPKNHFIQNLSVIKTTKYAHAKKYIFKTKLWDCNFHQILPRYMYQRTGWLNSFRLVFKILIVNWLISFSTGSCGIVLINTKPTPALCWSPLAAGPGLYRCSGFLSCCSQGTVSQSGTSIPWQHTQNSRIFYWEQQYKYKTLFKVLKC